MNNLKERFEKYIWQKNAPEMVAIDCRKIAIEFAKQLMQTSVTSHRPNEYDKGITIVESVPPEYSLMYGELVRNGDKLFNKFIEENYE